ncbi:MAG: exopolysaccharide biosynthesis polyprenyl glycosylphosphotransferase [Lachnospiraceae bacterium]|nr:exopolysaccharide biosynthesis polyprenyl glycosylphosphotransferase [Lachnospiraceae bacterium]
MKQKNLQSWLKHLDFLFFDLVAVEAALFLAYLIRFGRADLYASPEWRIMAILLPLIDLIVMILGSPLSGVLRRGYLKEAFAIVRQILIVIGVLTLYLYAAYEGITYSRLVIGLTGILYSVLTWVIRSLWKLFLRGKIRENVRRFVLIGEGELAERFTRSVESLRPGCEIVASFAGTEAGRLDKFLKSDDSGKRIEVVAALSAGSEKHIPEIVNICEKNGVRVDVIPFYADIMSSRASIEELGSVKLVNFRTTPLDNLTGAMIKRIFDVVSSIVLIILTSPVMLIAAIGTRLSGIRSVIFRQERVGRNRRVFSMYKFRTMRDTGEADTAWTTDDDRRKTRFGSFLRKFSIDEFPQFFNVLLGQMSLIGPRPEIPYHVEHFIDEIPMYQVRLQVRPGITGWAQVNGLRGDTDISERIRYDIWYIENWSVSLDLKIILRTVFGGMINSEKLK